MKTVYLMAQGQGSRWKDRKAPWPPGFEMNAPPYKHLLQIGDECLIARSARLFIESGFVTYVVAEPELLDLSGLSSIGITLLYTGTDVLDGIRSLLVQAQPSDDTVLAYGDVLFSRNAVYLISDSLKRSYGVMARVDPSTACHKISDEVFAWWFAEARWPTILERITQMMARGRLRPSKPWGAPFVALPDIEKTRRAYRTGHGLKTIRNDLVAINDYTDDIDSPEEWQQFWPDLLTKALEEK
jgi:hypothetical protein